MSAQTAILILTHQPARLPFLLDLLDDRFAIYVHVDAKADLALAPARLPPHVQVITPRIPVFWGGWSMMRATLALMEAARDHPRQVLISGDSLPVQSLDHLAETLSQPDTEYIDLIEVPDDPSLAGTDPRRAIERHGWVQPWRRHNYVFWDHPLLNPMQAEHAASRYGVPRAQLDWIRGEAQHAVAEILSQIPPRAALFPKFFYGAQWWALTGATIAGLLATLRDPAIEAYFRYMQATNRRYSAAATGTAPPCSPTTPAAPMAMIRSTVPAFAPPAPRRSSPASLIRRRRQMSPKPFRAATMTATSWASPALNPADMPIERRQVGIAAAQQHPNPLAGQRLAQWPHRCCRRHGA